MIWDYKCHVYHTAMRKWLLVTLFPQKETLQEIARGIILGSSSSPPSYSHPNKRLTAKQRGPACCWEQTRAKTGGWPSTSNNSSTFGNSARRTCIISGGSAHLNKHWGTHKLMWDSSVQSYSFWTLPGRGEGTSSVHCTQASCADGAFIQRIFNWDIVGNL